MVSFSRDRRAPVAAVLALASLTGGSLAPTAARAADMPFAPYAPPVAVLDEERVTFGTGWYLRGDVAATNDVKLSVGSVTIPANNKFANSWSAGLGFGYKYNEWIRTDVTADWRSPRRFEGNTAYGVACQIGAGPIYSKDPLTGLPTSTVVGSYPINSSCSDFTRTRLTAYHVLFNGYIDLPTFVGITPYVGAGVGVSGVYQKFTRNWFMNNQVAYAPTWTDPYTGGVYNKYWDVSRSATSYQFAWALMSGVSYAVTPHAAIDLGYRYLNLGNVTNYASLSGTTHQSLRSHELRVGLRYTPD